jgi:predicted DNA-binding transcriptional regulator AlpA
MPADSGPEHAVPDAGGAVRLDADSIDAIAKRVADILRSESLQTPEQLVTATDVAARFGVSRTWVYDNAERLGAIRLGTGSKARLRFDPRRVSELIQAEPNSRERPARRSPPAATRWLDKADLIPIRGH